MIVDYVSSAMEENDFYCLFSKSDKMPGQQAQKYNRLMIEGCAANAVKVHAVSGRPISRAYYKGAYLKRERTVRENITWLYESVLNLPLIKNLWQMIATYRIVSRDCKENNSAVILDVLNASVSLGAAMAAKRRRKPCIGIVTDLPELMVTGTSKMHVKFVHSTMKRCNGFVFLTEAMNEVVNPDGKPYIIVEGLSDVKCDSTERKEDISCKCMYAGYLDVRYGVKAMVDGFIKANVPNAELHVYGSGPYAEELNDVANKYSNVFFHGVVPNEVIVKEELKASLLINPRPTSEEFTKFSFPSKNIEYMSSGTPVITTDLPGMPREYLPFVYVFEKEDADGIAVSLKKVLSIPEEERALKGKKAKEFVLKEKNNVAQARKVIQLINQLF